MKYAIRAVLSCALVLRCAAPNPEFDEVSRECDSLTRCWAWQPGWGAWAQHYPEHVLDGFTELLPPPAGDACFRAVATSLPVCEVETDGVLLHGFPVEIADNLHEIELTSDVCADPAPFGEGGFARGECYGVIDGVAVRLDLSRPVPAEFAP